MILAPDLWVEIFHQNFAKKIKWYFGRMVSFAFWI